MKIQNMQNLFVDVLNSRDLTRAGDLFQIDDNLIVTDLSQLINQIETISSAHDFSQKLNDQSVVEICLTRITSAIRDTGTIEKHAKALVSLLESCLRQDLRPSKKDSDPFHAKIANELISCIFLNHDKKVIMRIAVPVAVKLLHRGNKELSRNLSSYLSLAAINNAEILAEHLSLIIDSVISGNFTLARVLPKIYPIRKEPIHDHVMALVCLLPQCETPEKLSLLALFQLVSKVEPKLLESNLPELSECLEQPQTSYPTLQVFLNMAQTNAKPFLEYVNKVVSACSLQQGMLSIAAQFLGTIGKLDLDRACDCMCFLTYQLSKSDLSTTIVILKEIKSIVEVFPGILSNFLKEILLATRNSSSNTVQNYLQQLNAINEQTNQSSSTVRVNCDQSAIGSFLSNNQLIQSFNQQSSLYNQQHNQPHNQPHNQANNQSIYDLGLSQTKSSNFKLNSSNFRLPISSGSYNSYKLVNTININPNNDSIHRSIPRLHSSSSHKQIGKQLSGSSQMHRSLTNCSNQKHGPLDYHHCSADSIATNNALNHALTHNSSPSSSSNQNMLRSSRPEIGNNPYVRVNTNLSTLLAGERSNYHLENAIYSTNNSSSKALLASTTNCNILDNPQLMQLQSSSSFSNAPHNFLSYSLNNKSYTLGNHYEYRDGIKQFCEKHSEKMKDYMERVNVKLPIPVRCSVSDERKSKKVAKLQLHFLCQIKDCHCLFSKTFFTMRTRYVRTWIHLMFLDLQAKSETPLYTSSPAVCELKNCYDALKDTHKENSGSNKNFLTLVTSSFPSTKEQDQLVLELKTERYNDVFEFNALIKSWCCITCNHPEKLNDFMEINPVIPVIQGQLAAKEKRGKWRIFRRWRERYFTLTGLSLSYRDKNSKNADQVEIGQVQSVRCVSSKRNKPNVFEIFTISKNEQKTYLLKAKNNKMSSEWVQCLSIAMAHSQAKENACG